MRPDSIINAVQDRVRLGPQPLVIDASGSSMLPVIREGQKVRVIACDPKRLNVGDIVLYRTGQSLIIHRIVAKSPAPRFQIICRGDNRPHNDAPIDPEDILGKVELFGETLASNLSIQYWNLWFAKKAALREALRRWRAGR